MTPMTLWCEKCYKITPHRYLKNRAGADGSRHVEARCRCGNPTTVVVPGKTGKEALAWVRAQEDA